MKTTLSTIVVLLCAGGMRAAEPVATAWVQRYSNDASAQGSAAKVLTDQDGNVIVAGSIDDRVSGTHFLVLKFSGAGVPLWTNYYHGPFYGDEYASAAAVDANGNVFVTGSSFGASNRSDYATVAYSSVGVPLWTNRYDGPNSGWDNAFAVAANSSGNVFVTGRSGGVDYPGLYDYATVAYSSAGVPLWTNRFNGVANGYDENEVLAVDGSGNVFVSGSEQTSDSYLFTTIKYSGSGVALWTNRYLRGWPAAMAVDTDGNVIITGKGTSGGSSPNFFFTTIKYSSAGALLWTNINRGYYSEGVAVDADGNVFIAGFAPNHTNSFDIITIKYSSAGVPLWTNRHDGTGGAVYSRNAVSVAVDGDGNALVSGYAGGHAANFYVTLKYSGAGVPLWTNLYHGGGISWGIALDSNGNVFVTGNTGSVDDRQSVVVTVAYSSTGGLLWTNHHSEVGNQNDIPAAVAADAAGNVFATGSSIGLSIDSDYATIKYSGAGVPLWTNRYNGPGNRNDNAKAMAVDGNGDVLVTGISWGIDSSADYATIKYSGAGVPLWTNRYNGPGNGRDSATAIAVDSSGNVFVTGASWFDTNTFSDILTIKYSGAGVPLWTNRFSATSYSDDWSSSSIVVDRSGNVIVAGFAVGYVIQDCDTTETNISYSIVKYSAPGVPLWTNYLERPGNESILLVVDSSDSVIATANPSRDDGSFDLLTIKYSGAGVPLWTNRFPGGYAWGVVVDGSRNVFVSGGTTTLKYSEAGVPLWTNFHSTCIGCAGGDLAVDSRGNVVLTGSSTSEPGIPRDVVTIKYSGAGVLLWSNRYDGPAHGYDQPSYRASIAIGPDGSVLVTAASEARLNEAYDIVTIKYVSPELTIRRSAADVIVSWPSPFSDFTLQQNITGLNTANWSDVSGPIQDNGVNCTVTIGSPIGHQFYRLYKP